MEIDGHHLLVSDSDDEKMAPTRIGEPSRAVEQDVTFNEKPPAEQILLEEKIIDKILGVRQQDSPQGPITAYFIKWRLKSYLHASWETQAALEIMDLNAKSKIRRFVQNPLENNVMVPADEADEFLYFNHEFLEPDRILSCDPPTAAHKDAATEQELQAMLDQSSPCMGPVEGEIFYYVKWRRMQYNECTWERAYDLKHKCSDIFNFWNRQKIPKDFNYGSTSISVQDYEKMETSPVYGSPDSGLTLRGYQLEGVNWMLWNWFHKRSCILADEMGLGKTIQTACFLQQLRTQKTIRIRGPHLIIAPLSLIRQWESELNEWCPDINCVVLHGNGEARDVLVQNEFYYQEPFSGQADIRDAKKRQIFKFDVLLTTYEVAVRDLSFITRVNWKVLVLDEGHRLKNPSSRAFEKLLSIQREFCILLTGTPLQNKTEELWSLLHFCNQHKFSNLHEFSQKFGDLKGSADVADLHGVLKPYLLRRIKEDVEKSLPPKEETIIEVTLTSIQKKYYRAVYEKNAEFLYRGAKASNGPCLMNVMMELRKCCNHPYLLNGVEERVLEDIHCAHADKSETSLQIMNRALIESSGKLVLLDKLLPRLQQEGHKVLIFSQMVRALNIIEDFMNIRGYKYERLDGSTRVQDRLSAIDRFGKPSLNTFVMLLSTKAGGLGLNLTAADTVIIYDSDWNPQNDLQAQARAHRIGQTKPVVVYRLLTKATYEMQMFHRASLKLGLDRAVLAHTRRAAQEGSGSVSDTLKVSEIDELLKRGAYDVFREDDNDIKEFMAADVDAILARSSTTVQYDKDAVTSLSGTLGKFSKASFVSADDTEDVDINDPEFWWKTMRIENKIEAYMIEDAAAYNQVAVGTNGEPKIVRSSLRKRKKIEGWTDSQGTLSDLSKSQKRQIYGEADNGYDELRSSDCTSSSDDEKDKTKKEKNRQQKLRRITCADDVFGEKKRKAKAMVVMLEGKFPGMNSLAAFRHSNQNVSHQYQNVPFNKYLRFGGHFDDNAEILSQKSRSDTSQWNPTARDRCIDLLLKFGFGRWHVIARRMHASGRPEVGNYSVDDIESFCRNIVMQCGLSAVKNHDGAQSAGYTDFIQHAINAAVCVQQSIDMKEQHFEIPAVLLQDSFQKKLSSGRAIKALHRLDILNRVIAIVSSGASSVHSAFPGQYSSGGVLNDIDTMVEKIPNTLLAQYIKKNSVRPPWLHICDWWDDTCDANLIIGTFKHGFSAYDEMGSDPTLCFHLKLIKANVMYKSLPHGNGSIAESSMEPAVSIIRLDETRRCRLTIPPNRWTDFIGVCSHPGSASWIAFAVTDLSNPDKSTEILGFFVEEIKAARAYDRFVRKHYTNITNSRYETNFDEFGMRTAYRAKWPVRRPALQWFHSSVFHGVRSAGNKWQVSIGFEGELRHVGSFATDIEAAVVHDRFTLMRAQHTGVGINFQTARDVVSELQNYAIRGDIRLDFFDVPKSAEEKLLSANASLSATEPVYGEEISLALLSGELPAHMLRLVSTDVSSAAAYDFNTKTCTGDTNVSCSDVLNENSYATGSERKSTDPITAVENMEGKFNLPFQIQSSFEPIKRVEMSAAAIDAVLSDEPDTVAEVLLAPRLDTLSTTSSATNEPAEFDIPQGHMPDSRTLNRLLTCLLSVREIGKTDASSKLFKKSVEVNPRRMLEDNIRSRAGRKQRYEPLYDGAVDKAEILRGLIESGKVQAPSVYLPLKPSNRVSFGTGESLAGLGKLTPEAATVATWEASNRFKYISRKLSKQDDPSTDPDSDRAAMLRVLAKSKMSLQRDEISILAETNGAEPMFMIAALRAGLIKKCQQIVDSYRPLPEEFDARLSSLLEETNKSEVLRIRNIVDAEDLLSDADLVDVAAVGCEERDRLTSFFIIHGAPTLNVDSSVTDSFPTPYIKDSIHSLSSSKCPYVPQECFIDMVIDNESNFVAESEIGRRILSWNQVKIATGSSLTDAELRRYYEQVWLPFCDQITRPVAGLSAELEIYRGTIEIPNPFKDVSAHSPAARGLVETFLLHQRVVLTIRYVIWNMFSELQQFLRSDKSTLKGSSSHLYKTFPEWWCPSVHDLGLLVGCLLHGYLAIKEIVLDAYLPYTRARIEAYFRKHILNGSEHEADVQAVLKSVEGKFPDSKEIEHRIIEILTAVTANLPNGHFAKLSSVFVQSDRSSTSAVALKGRGRAIEIRCNEANDSIGKKRKYAQKMRKGIELNLDPFLDQPMPIQNVQPIQQMWQQHNFNNPLGQMYSQLLRPPEMQAVGSSPSDMFSAMQRQRESRLQFQIQSSKQAASQQHLAQNQAIRQQVAQQQALQHQLLQQQAAQRQQAQQQKMFTSQQFQQQLSQISGLTGHLQGVHGQQGLLGAIDQHDATGQQVMSGFNFMSGPLGVPQGQMSTAGRQGMPVQHLMPGQYGMHGQHHALPAHHMISGQHQSISGYASNPSQQLGIPGHLAMPGQQGPFLQRVLPEQAGMSGNQQILPGMHGRYNAHSADRQGLLHYMQQGTNQPSGDMLARHQHYSNTPNYNQGYGLEGAATQQDYMSRHMETPPIQPPHTDMKGHQFLHSQR